MSRNKHYRSQKFAQRKKRKKIIKYSAFLIFLILLILSISFLSFHKGLTINSIKISDNKYLEEYEVIEKINKILDERYFFLFSKRNFLIYPKAKIRESILTENISILNLNLELNGLNQLIVSVTEHRPVAKWCTKDDEDCYLVNQDGLIYIKDKSINKLSTESSKDSNSDILRGNEHEKLLKLYGIRGSLENIIGQHYLETDLFDNIMKTVDYLRDIDFNASHISTIDGETFSVYFIDKPYLLISKYGQPKNVIQNLKITIETEELNRAQLENLEYIDLRFGNKVYYKIR